MGYFNNMEGVAVSDDGVRLPFLNANCDYYLEIDSAKIVPDKFRVDHFEVIATVLGTTDLNPDLAVGRKSKVVRISTAQKMFFEGDVKKVVGACFGGDINKPQEFSLAASTQNCNDAVEKQSLKGRYVICTVVNHKTQAGKDFAKPVFAPATMSLADWNIARHGVPNPTNAPNVQSTMPQAPAFAQAPQSPAFAQAPAFAPAQVAPAFAPAQVAPAFVAPPQIAPPAIQTPAAWSPPAGWAIHPDSPAHVWQPSTGQYSTIVEFRKIHG